MPSLSMVSVWLLYLLLWASFARSMQSCNGRVEYCSRKYADITFMGAHNSPFYGNRPTQNQDASPTNQLDYGIRFLTAPLRKRHGDVFLCHTSCMMENAGTLRSFLENVNSWLIQNPDQVVTLLFTQGQGFDVEVLDHLFQSTGIASFAYVPPTSPGVLPIDQWPTLGNLISTKKRLIVFIGMTLIKL